jgi:hypothetical protein
MAAVAPKISMGAEGRARVSRFGPVDPFYRAMAEAESAARIDRFAAADRERYRRQMLALPLPAPIVDHDPGDEQEASSR